MVGSCSLTHNISIQIHLRAIFWNVVRVRVHILWIDRECDSGEAHLYTFIWMMNVRNEQFKWINGFELPDDRQIAECTCYTQSAMVNNNELKGKLHKQHIICTWIKQDKLMPNNIIGLRTINSLQLILGTSSIWVGCNSMMHWNLVPWYWYEACIKCWETVN